MFGLNNSQVIAFVERLAVVATGYAVGKGFVAPEDATTITAILVAIVSGAIALWNNRNKRLAERTASAGMTVIAPPQIADHTKSRAVVSSADNMVVPK
jgi:hypothetical protein